MGGMGQVEGGPVGRAAQEGGGVQIWQIAVLHGLVSGPCSLLGFAPAN